MDTGKSPDLDLSVHRAAMGDETAFAVLMHRMIPLMRAQVHRFDHLELDEDDLMQESLLGLLAAVRHYRTNGGASFTTYACACIHNRLVSLARRCGDRALREQPLDADVPDGPDADPEQQLLEQEEASRLQTQLQQRLTPLEYEVLLARLRDCSYEETAAHLGISKKAVDNAVQRLRHKLSADT